MKGLDVKPAPMTNKSDPKAVRANYIDRADGFIQPISRDEYQTQVEELHDALTTSITSHDETKRRLEAAEAYILAFLKHHDALVWGEYKTMDEHNASVGNLGRLQDEWRALPAGEETACTDPHCYDDKEHLAHA